MKLCEVGQERCSLLSDSCCNPTRSCILRFASQARNPSIPTDIVSVLFVGCERKDRPVGSGSIPGSDPAGNGRVPRLFQPKMPGRRGTDEHRTPNTFHDDSKRGAILPDRVLLVRASFALSLRIGFEGDLLDGRKLREGDARIRTRARGVLCTVRWIFYKTRARTSRDDS